MELLLGAPASNYIRIVDEGHSQLPSADPSFTGFEGSMTYSPDYRISRAFHNCREGAEQCAPTNTHQNMHANWYLGL